MDLTVTTTDIPGKREETGDIPGLLPARPPVGPVPPTGRALVSVMTAYALLMGPAVLMSVAIVLFILGGLSPQDTNDALAFAPHLQAASTAGAVATALVLAGRSLRRGLLPVPARLGPGAADNLLYAAELIGYPLCLLTLLDASHLDGYDPAGIAAMALAGATLCPLLAQQFGGCRSLLGRLAGRSHAAASRRALVLCITGMLLVPPAGIALTNVFLHFAPLDEVYRFALTQGGSPVNMADGWMVNTALMACNAVTEETVAMLLVLAMRHARRPVWQIIALAVVLRIGYHLQDGPFGLAAGVFGAANAFALLRYRKVLPLMVAHFVYDTAVYCSANLFAGHQILTEYAPLLLCPPVIATLLLVDVTVRRPGFRADAFALNGHMTSEPRPPEAGDPNCGAARAPIPRASLSSDSDS